MVIARIIIKPVLLPVSNKEAARDCEATFPPRIHAALAESADGAARINPSAIVFQDGTKRIALVPLTRDSTKMARVDLNEVRNGGPAACDNLCMVLSKIPCPHVVAAAGAANVNMMSIICPELTTAHWKEQYEGTAFPLPSYAQIEAHADLINKSICLPPALKRPKGRPKSMKRKKGYIEKHGKKRSCSKCHMPGHSKKTCPGLPSTGGPAATTGGLPNMGGPAAPWL